MTWGGRQQGRVCPWRRCEGTRAHTHTQGGASMDLADACRPCVCVCVCVFAGTQGCVCVYVCLPLSTSVRVRHCALGLAGGWGRREGEGANGGRRRREKNSMLEDRPAAQRAADSRGVTQPIRTLSARAAAHDKKKERIEELTLLAAAAATEPLPRSAFVFSASCPLLCALCDLEPRRPAAWPLSRAVHTCTFMCTRVLPASRCLRLHP